MKITRKRMKIGPVLIIIRFDNRDYDPNQGATVDKNITKMAL